MKVIEVSSFGAPDVLRLADRPAPVFGTGEVLIQVAASGINRPDVLQRGGYYPAPPGASDILGLEVAGVIVDGDASAMRDAGIAVGDRVCALVAGGGYAQMCVAPVGQCLPIPAGLTDIEAASLPETVFTVWSNVFERAHLQPGETLLIQGGSSGIGVTAIQLAKAFDANVFVTAGTDEKCLACIALGADLAINYRQEDFEERLASEGVDVILDMIGGDYVAKNIRLLRADGRMVFINSMNGSEMVLNIRDIMKKRLTITGSTLRNREISFKSALAQEIERMVWPMLEKGKFKPVIFKTFPLNEASKAHRLMESSTHIGKIILVIDY